MMQMPGKYPLNFVSILFNNIWPGLLRFSGVKFSFLQLICTGTFYEEWINESPWLPLPNLLTVFCVILYVFMIMLIQVSKREFKHNQNEYQSHVVKVNFGSFTISWIVFIFVVLGMIALKKVTRYFQSLIIGHIALFKSLSSK